MQKRIYVIDRYDNFKKNNKKFSGYEQVVKNSNIFKKIKRDIFLEKILIKIVFSKVMKPKDYIKQNISKEIKALFYSFFTGQPIFYLYADKDAFLLPLIKRKLKIKRVKIYGTLHWPYEESQMFSFYKNNLEKQFNGIITLSSSLGKVINSNKIAIPHGIDLHFWERVTWINDFNNYYLMIGESNRDHYNQVRIIDYIKSKDSDASFVFLSSNKKSYSFYQDRSDVKIIDVKITDEELKNLYSKSKAVILIQKNCLASNVVMESLSMGIPLIVNNVGDISEYLGDDYQLYVDLDSIDSSNIEKFIFSNDFRKNISDYLLKKRDRYGWKEISDRTLNFIISNK